MSAAGAPAPDPERNAPPIPADGAAWLVRELAGIHDPSDPGPAPHEWPRKKWMRYARGMAECIIQAAKNDVGDRAAVDVVFDVLAIAVKAVRR